MRGILSSAAVLHTAEGVVAFPAGSQIDVVSNDDWYHDVQDADIDEALDLLEEAQ